MPDYTVSGSLPSDPNSKSKHTRQGQVPLKELIQNELDNFGVQNQKQAEKIIRETLNELYQQSLSEYEFNKDSFHELLGNFGIKGRGIGTFKTNLKKIMERSDTSQVKKFDEMAEFARKYVAQVLPQGATDEDALVNALVSNYPERPKKRDLVGAALEKAVDTGALTEDYFDYSVFEQDTPGAQDVAELLSSIHSNNSNSNFEDVIANANDYYKKSAELTKQANERLAESLGDTPLHNEQSMSDGGQEPPKTPPVATGVPEPDEPNRPSSQGTPQGTPLDDLVQNEFFSPEEMQEMLRGARSGGKKSGGDGERLDNLRFSAVESIASQLMSRAFGTSFYPVLTALRTAREVTKLETGEDVGIGDVMDFTANSTNKMLSKGIDTLGLGGFEDTIRKVLGIDKPGEWMGYEGAMPLANDPSENLSRAAEDLSGAANSLDTSSNALDSLAENGGFGGGGDGPIDPSGFSTPDPEDGDNDESMSPAEQIAGLAGLAIIGKIVSDLVGHAVSKLSETLSDQVQFGSNLAYSSMASPGSVSGVQMAGQPFKAAAGVANAFAPAVGARVGLGVGKAAGAGAGRAIGAGLGRIAGGGAGRAVGAALGTAIPIPVVGTLIGMAAGGIIGDMISGTVGAAIDILKSIDDGIHELSVTLTPFSEELVGATVESDIARLQNQMRQADQLGSMLADNVTARSDFEIAISNLGAEIAYAFTPLMTGLYEFLTPIVDMTSTVVAGITALVKVALEVQEFFSYMDTDFTDGFNAIQNFLDRIAGNTAKDPQFLQELDDFLNPQVNQQALNPQLLNNVGAFGGFTI